MLKLVGSVVKAMAQKSADRDEELKQMVRCVQLFFSHHKQQGEIAQKLGIHQSKVSRLLKRALDEGLYSVELRVPTLPDLAGRLIDRYLLRDAVVVPTGELENLKEDLGRAGATYFERVIGSGAKVGVSCGTTLFYLIKHLREGSTKGLHIYPLAAETTLSFVDISFNTLVGMMTAKYRPIATGYALPAQLLKATGTNRNAHDSFLNDPDIRKIFKESHDVDIALVGIGGLDPQTPGFSELAMREGVSTKRLQKLGVAGEFNYQPFDKGGRPLSDPTIASLMNRFIGVPLSRFQELSELHGRLVVAVAGGPKKLGPIQSALAGRLFNVLITDQDTANKLLSPES